MTIDDDKRLSARAAVDLVEDGMVLGLGTGSTAVFAIEMLAERVKSGLKIKAVPTSDATAQLAKSAGIPLVTLDECPDLDLDIDGADEVDPCLCLIKGGGGALLREKIVAYASRRVIIIVDEKKLVQRLGKFHLPVEVIPFSLGMIEKKLVALGATSTVRASDGKVFRTDENNLILDCDFGLIDNPRLLAEELSMVPGIVEHGLFVDMVELVFVGHNGIVKTLSRK